jgi:SDR family mycofactocin-dependent oxidoreductase
VIAADRAANDPRLPYALGSHAELQALVASLDPERVSAAVVEAADADAMARLMADTELLHGGVDAVIAAAGVVAGGVPLWDMPGAALDAVIETNLGGVIAAARAGIPALLRRPQPRAGRFVAVASSAASRGLPMLAAYCAAKAGVTGMVRALALELRGSGVTANAVSPGSTNTPILEESARLYQLDSAERFAAHQPIERLLRPQEIAALIVWLAGDGGAGVTGADYLIDGGLSL